MAKIYDSVDSTVPRTPSNDSPVHFLYITERTGSLVTLAGAAQLSC